LFPSLLILASAGVSPNIFVAAQAGIADMKVMSPPVDALGIGFMGKEMPTMPLMFISHILLTVAFSAGSAIAGSGTKAGCLLTDSSETPCMNV